MMITFKKWGIFYLLIFIVLTSAIGQETYQWTHFKSEALYRLYKTDFFKMDTLGELVLELPDSLFTHKNMTGFDNVIYSFEFTPDRTQIYFLEREGDLYLYDLTSDNLEYITDVTPDNSNPLVHGLQRTYDLFYFNDSTLYCFGDAHLTFNLNSQQSTLYRRIPSVPLIVDPYERSINLFQMFMYKEDTLGSPVTKTIVRPKFFEPEDRQVWITPNYDYQSSLNYVAYHFDCDSVALFHWIHYPIEGVPFSLYYTEMDTFGFHTNNGRINMRPLQLLSNNVDLYRIKNYPGFDYKGTCVRIVNLDEDESTHPGIDYKKSQLCNIQNTPIADEDTRISHSYTLDSVVIAFTQNNLTCSFNIYPGNYNILYRGNSVVLEKRPTTKNKDYTEGVRLSTCSCTELTSGQNIHYGITAWYKGVPGETAWGTLETLSDLPTAGDDQNLNYCIDGDSILHLTTILSDEADHFGLFTFNQTNIDGDSLLIVSNQQYDLMYIVGQEFCPDTALFTIYVIPNPVTANITDQYSCFDNPVIVDLSALDGEIIWSDGSLAQIRNITQSGYYAYTITNEMGCTSNNDFSVHFSSPTIVTDINLWACEGENFYYESYEFSSAGIDTITQLGITNCDSIITFISRNYYPTTIPSWQAPLGLCPHESGYISILNNFQNILINGQSTTSNILIDTPGHYELKGQDINNCPVVWEIDILSYPSPVVFMRDMIDTLWNQFLTPAIVTEDNNINYNWSPSDMFDCLECPQPHFLSGIEGIFALEVTNEWGCKTKIQANISYQKSNYHLPNAISSNSLRPENNLFYLISNNTVQYDLAIYDRWGNKVHFCNKCISNDRSNAWIPDSTLQQGVYVYFVTIYDNDKKTLLSGDVTLIR